MIKKLVLGLVIGFFATQSFAKEFIYQGHVKGMACAFCVYKVRKSISQIPGVKAASVNIDLKSGVLNVRSSLAIDQKKIAGVITEAGFKLSEFKETKNFTLASYKKDSIVSLKLSSVDIKQYGAILEKVGDIAESGASKLVIRAPKSIEIALLKPLIAGRKKVARVEFIESKSDSIQLTVYQQSK